MEETQIIVDTKEKITTIRLTEKTKKQLETYAVGKETHEQIIHRLMKLADNRAVNEGTVIIQKNNAIGIKYNRMNTLVPIRLHNTKYKVLCTYNDLHIFFYLKNQPNAYAEYVHPRNNADWEVDLEIVNLMKDQNWDTPTYLKEKSSKEYLLLYLITLKYVLEENFAIKLYEFETESDYLDVGLWEKAYKRNHLSIESFISDVEKKVRL